jgi:hypothetical protein
VPDVFLSSRLIGTPGTRDLCVEQFGTLLFIFSELRRQLLGMVCRVICAIWRLRYGANLAGRNASEAEMYLGASAKKLADSLGAEPNLCSCRVTPD